MSYKISETDILSYNCNHCGRCCQSITDKIIIEVLDACRMVKTPKLHCINLAEIYERYTHPTFIPSISEGGYPTFLLNVREDNSCIFLENGSCTIYEFRPRICRTYPFVVRPAPSRQELQISPCMDQNSGHFSGGSIAIKQWLRQFLSEEDQNFLVAEYGFVAKLHSLFKQMPLEKLLDATMEAIYLHYFNYDPSEAFLPQYCENMEKLVNALADMV